MLERAAGINIQRRADLAGQLIDVHLFAKQLAVAILKPVHDLHAPECGSGHCRGRGDLSPPASVRCERLRALLEYRPMTMLFPDLNIDAVIAGEARLTAAQALDLYLHAELHDLGEWAAAVANRLHGDRVRTYVIDRNVNYTNVCSASCTFCAFYRKEGDTEAYVLNTKQLHDKLRELSDIGGTQVLLQGGMHPGLPLSWYEDMLAAMRAEFPNIHLHAFSPPEFVEFTAVCDIEGFPTTAPGEGHTMDRATWLEKLAVIMRRLMDAGLASIPGGGGEIFPPHVRRRIGQGKASGEQWLDVMRTGHQLGMNTSSTMMFGHIEGIADRMMHMQMIREAQDEAIKKRWPGRYMSFITWPFQPDNTPLGKLPRFDRESGEPFPGDVLAEAVMRGDVDPTDKAACQKIAPHHNRMIRLAGATDYLRTQAIARLFLDNIHSIGSSWVTMGPKIGQIGLFFGANDMGSVMMEENVVSSAGTTYCLNEASICRLIRDAGFVPAQRDNAYRILKTHEHDGPDTRVSNWAEHRPAASAFAPPPEQMSKPVTLTVGDAQRN
ncbi:MAG: radical SAM protein [Planctomycetes bacterium]|nr:radical SAM protein [Planctomycetota bacterium]